jgi:CheY-like chemotaxis protein
VVALRVLAAEDNAVNRLVLKTLMEPFGVEVEVVDNGVLAVEAWARGAFDLILMDVQMPVMDGPTASRLIRERERAEGLRRIPIIALTANALSHQRDEYIDAGMDDVVAKPLELQVLMNAMSRVLDQGRETSRAAASG